MPDRSAPNLNAGGEADPIPGSDIPPKMPLWVKVFAGVALILALLFILAHLGGRGLHDHSSLGHDEHHEEKQP